MTKLWISVDMEGISGLPDYTYVNSSESNYETGRRIMTMEANSVVQAAVDFGIEDIVVNDSHSKMNNILIEEIHPEAKLISGDVKPMSMVQGLDDQVDLATFIGYHSRAGKKGVMSHSMTFGVRNFWINDQVVGELGLNAYVAGFYDVPVILVAGDDCVADEAKQLMPNITTCIVKRALSRSSHETLSPAKATELLREKTLEALERKAIDPLKPPKNPTLRVEFTNYGEAEWAALIPQVTIEPGTTIVKYEANTIIDAYQAMVAMTELAMKTKFC
ncbi:aminopeptidase [Terrilactibacillus sp. BCM23-1]|uniref:Aminopeptidase n=1 Tax=Terrilactibacillus tamarindi TaxID=2599694 RepID=A0A6N8CTG2_9BACI|nr:M55 family metallopeptidase [Terrilactibacillus tamarindi]MTT32958.1 aminopeptidase [Terrilactibacillus tamarindi]